MTAASNSESRKRQTPDRPAASDTGLTPGERLYLAHGWSGCAGSAWSRLAPATRDGWEFAARAEQERDVALAYSDADAETAAQMAQRALAAEQRAAEVEAKVRALLAIVDEMRDWAEALNATPHQSMVSSRGIGRDLAAHLGRLRDAAEGWTGDPAVQALRDRAALSDSAPEAEGGIADLIERSSLGTPEAKAARASVSDEDAARVVARSRELEAEDRARADERASAVESAPATREADPAPEATDAARPCFPRSKDGHNCTLGEGHLGPHVCCDGHEWIDGSVVGLLGKLQEAVDRAREARIARSEADTTGGEGS